MQALRYTYDPVGNITEIIDGAVPKVFFNNFQIDAHNLYTYDALYRLTKAEGREHAGQVVFNTYDNWNDCPFRKQYHPNDAMAWRNYTECYDHDSVGNILTVKHTAQGDSGNSWTRQYQYATTSNRLLATGTGSEAVEHYIDHPTLIYRYHYNPHGSMNDMPHLTEMDWDFTEHLSHIVRAAGSQEDKATGCPNTSLEAWYRYGAGKQRTRKRVVKHAGTIEERLYLAGLEIYRKSNGNGVMLERETLHVMDDMQRIALVETRTLDTAGNDRAPRQLIRYQFGNHLSSASLELDEQAQIISYEEYAPYGSTTYQAVRSQTETVKWCRYTGKERDEDSGFYYHGTRYYAPWLGSWTAPDPEGLVDGTNLYWYARGSPIIFLDYEGERAATPQEQNILGILNKLEVYHLKRFRDMSKAAQAWDFFMSGSGAARQSAILQSHCISLTKAIGRAKEGEAVLPVVETPATIDITGDKDRKLFELTRYTNYVTESEGRLIQTLRVSDAIGSNPLSGLAYGVGIWAGASEETKGNLALAGEALWGVVSVSPGIVSGIKQNSGLSAMRRGMRLQMQLETQMFAGKHPLAKRDTNISVGIAWDHTGKPTILVSVNKGASKAVIEQLREQAQREGGNFIYLEF